MDNPAASEWNSCPPDELDRMLDGIRRRHRERNIVRLSSWVACFVVTITILGASGVVRSPWSGAADFGGISCRDVQQQVDAYRDGSIYAVTRVKIDAHLQQCPRCQKKYDGVVRADVRNPRRLASLALPAE